MSAEPEYPCRTNSVRCSNSVIAPTPLLQAAPLTMPPKIPSAGGMHIETIGALLIANIGTG